MNWRAVAMAGLLGISAGAQANSLSIGLSDDAARFEFQTTYSGLGLNNADLTFGVLYNDDSDWLGGAQLSVFGDAAAPGSGLHAGAGISLTAGDVGPNGDVLAIGLGGQVRYVLPQANRFAFRVQGFFAPEITSFQDSEGYSDWALQGEYELTRSARVFLGYRSIEVDLDSGKDVAVEKGLYGGLQMIF